MIRPGGSGAGAAGGPVDSLSWRPWSTPGRAPDGALPRAGAPLCLIKALGGGGGWGGCARPEGCPARPPQPPPIPQSSTIMGEQMSSWQLPSLPRAVLVPGP